MPLAGIYKYVASNEALDRVVLADVTTVRSLADFTLGYETADSSARNEDIDNAFDMDNLFAENTDVQQDMETEFDLTGLESVLADTADRDSLVLTDNGAWNFILVKAEEGKEAEMINALNRGLASGETGARVLSWRRAAGNAALAVFAVQSLFNIGMGFLVLGALLVIMNSFVISVFERTAEIGTMRSLGAQGGFIRKLFVTESLVLTMTSALAGIILGILLALLIENSSLHLENPLLISLFGGTEIHTGITLSIVALHAGLALLVGALAWIYPVHLAIRVQPISAMNSV